MSLIFNAYDLDVLLKVTGVNKTGFAHYIDQIWPEKIWYSVESSQAIFEHKLYMGNSFKFITLYVCEILEWFSYTPKMVLYV